MTEEKTIDDEFQNTIFCKMLKELESYAEKHRQSYQEIKPKLWALQQEADHHKSRYEHAEAMIDRLARRL